MKWNAWGDAAAAKPLSDGIRALLKQAVGLDDSAETELDPDNVTLRPSALSEVDRNALAAIVGAEYFRSAARDRLLHAGGKSTIDLLRRQPELIPHAIEEVLRLESPFRQMMRSVPHDTTLGGVDPAALVKDAALRLLEEDTRFRAGVRKGIEQADRGAGDSNAEDYPLTMAVIGVGYALLALADIEADGA